MKKIKRTLVGAVAAASLLLAGCTNGLNEGNETKDENNVPTPNNVQTQTLNMAVYVGENSSDGQLVNQWAEKVAELTDGRLEIATHFNAVLLPAADTLAGVGDGRAEAGYLGTVYTPNELPLSNVSGIPYVTGNQEAQMYTFMELFESNEDFQQEYLQHKVRPVFFLPVGSPLLGSHEELASIDDLQGKKIRGVGSMTQALEAVGVTPMAIPFNELFESLDRKVIDAYSGVLFDTGIDSHLYEVAPHVSDAGMGNFSIQAVVLANSVWESLSEEDQTALHDAAESVMANVVENRHNAAVAGCEVLAAGGGSATVWDENEQERWKEAIGDTIRDTWAESAGPAAESFYEEYIQILKEQEAKSTATSQSELAVCATL